MKPHHPFIGFLLVYAITILVTMIGAVMLWGIGAVVFVLGVTLMILVLCMEFAQ